MFPINDDLHRKSLAITCTCTCTCRIFEKQIGLQHCCHRERIVGRWTLCETEYVGVGFGEEGEDLAVELADCGDGGGGGGIVVGGGRVGGGGRGGGGGGGGGVFEVEAES